MTATTVTFTIQGKRIDLEETEEIMALLETDDEFTYQYFEKAIEENKLEQFGVFAQSINDVEIVRETGSRKVQETNSDDDSEEAETSISVNNVWTTQATKLLLTLYKEASSKVGKTIKLKNKKAMWKHISEEMAKQNHTFTVQQIENRYKTLDRGFKDKTINNKKTGRNRASCLFEKELTEINRDKRTVFPECLLGASGNGKDASTFRAEVGIEGRVEINSNENSAVVDDSPGPSSRSSTPTSSSTSKKSRTILEELRKLREQKDMELLEINSKKDESNRLKKRSLELEEAKLEAYKERTEAIKRKASVLEKLLEKLSQ